MDFPTPHVTGGDGVKHRVHHALMMLQASGDPRMAQVLTWISGSTYNATDAQVWRTGIVMVILLAITPLCRRWLTIYRWVVIPPEP